MAKGVVPLAARLDLQPGAVALGAGTAGVAAAAAVTVGPAAVAIPLAIAAGVFLVREPFALLALYLWIGLFKEQSIVRAFPVDVTLALGLLLAGVCFFRWASGRARSVPFGLAAPVAAVGLVLVVSLAWTPSAAYGGEKALKFLTLTLLATLAPFFLVERERDVRRYFSWTVVMAAVTALATLANPPASDGRLTLGSEGNTIGISHLLCTAALILLVAALTDLVPSPRLAVAGSVALIAVAAAIGSRGPLLSLVFTLVVCGAVWLARVPRKILPVLLVVALGAALLPFLSLPQDSAQRLTGAATNPIGTAHNDPRYVIFGQAVSLIEHHPVLGVGAGGFQSVGRLSHPAENYPHNMFLEVWSELGLAVVVVVAVSVIAVLTGLWRGAWNLTDSRSSGLLYVLIAFFVFNLFEAQLTGDLNGNRAYWAIFGLAWLVVQDGLPPKAPPHPTSEMLRR
ncbi:MAG: O-antigen ligase family protein [Solirubrobacteraceae bacterium]